MLEPTTSQGWREHAQEAHTSPKACHRAQVPWPRTLCGSRQQPGACMQVTFHQFMLPQLKENATQQPLLKLALLTQQEFPNFCGGWCAACPGRECGSFRAAACAHGCMRPPRVPAAGSPLRHPGRDWGDADRAPQAP